MAISCRWLIGKPVYRCTGINVKCMTLIVVVVFLSFLFRSTCYPLLRIVFGVANCLFIRVCTIASRCVILVSKVGRGVQVHANVCTYLRGERYVLERTDVIIVIVSGRWVSFRVTNRVFRVALFMTFQIAL